MTLKILVLVIQQLIITKTKYNVISFDKNTDTNIEYINFECDQVDIIESDSISLSIRHISNYRSHILLELFIGKDYKSIVIYDISQLYKLEELLNVKITEELITQIMIDCI